AWQRGTGRGIAPQRARADRDHPRDRAADGDRLPRVPQAAQRRAPRARRRRRRSWRPVTAAAILDRVEQRITQLVQGAPQIDAAAIDALIDALRQIGSPLALAIARILELVALELVDPGVALPPLAMACATLAAGVRGELGERELEAARYEIDT